MSRSNDASIDRTAVVSRGSPGTSGYILLEEVGVISRNGEDPKLGGTEVVIFEILPGASIQLFRRQIFHLCATAGPEVDARNFITVERMPLIVFSTNHLRRVALIVSPAVDGVVYIVREPVRTDPSRI